MSLRKAINTPESLCKRARPLVRDTPEADESRNGQNEALPGTESILSGEAAP